MLRVRNDDHPMRRGTRVLEPVAAASPLPSPSRLSRLAAMAGVGMALGAGGAVLAVSMVQAGDDAGVRAFHLQEAASRRASLHQSAPAATAYAPSRPVLSLPLFQTRGDGRIAHPPVALNPFARAETAAGAAPRGKPKLRQAGLAPASSAARSICVRLCDGFHAPIGLVRTSADMKAHDELCRAMNPGVPVQVFRVPAGVESIDGAQTLDGKRYNTMPVAFGYEKAADPACRPAIVKEGERRVSLLRDFTLRPGDSVVLDGKVKTFVGGSRWPYSPRDFRDFRTASELSQSERREIDERVGLSRREADARSLRRRMALREASLQEPALQEASLQDPTIASDALPLRGSLGPTVRGPVRIIAISATGQ